VAGHAPSVYIDSADNIFALEGHDVNTLQPSVEVRSAAGTWGPYSMLSSGPPNRDGSSSSRWDLLWPGNTSHLDEAVMDEDGVDQFGNHYAISYYLHAALSSTSPPPDTTPPTVSITSPASGATVSGTMTVSASASDNVGVAGVQFQLDGANAGAEVTAAPYQISWDTTTATNGSHSLTARARDAAGNTTTSAAVAVTVSNSSPPPPPPPPPSGSGLVAAYSFNENTGSTVHDASGNNNTGTISAAQWTSSGRYGSALSFNGASSILTVADSPTLDLTTGLTLEAWVNPSATPQGWQAVLFKEMPGDGAYFLYRSGYGPVPVAGIFSGVERQILGTSGPGVNTWTHLAFTYDGAVERLYVNGVQVSSRAQTGAIQTSTGVLHIGGDDLWGEYFQGLIDEIRIYNRALSAAEVQTDMNTPVQ